MLGHVESDEQRREPRLSTRLNNCWKIATSQVISTLSVRLCASSFFFFGGIGWTRTIVTRLSWPHWPSAKSTKELSTTFAPSSPLSLRILEQLNKWEKETRLSKSKVIQSFRQHYYKNKSLILVERSSHSSVRFSHFLCCCHSTELLLLYSTINSPTKCQPETE